MIRAASPKPPARSMPRKLDETSETERMQLVIHRSLVNRIDEWRRKSADLPNRSEAVRRLIELGLRHEG